MMLQPKQARAGDPALLAPGVDAVHQRNRALREAIGGADIHVRHVHDVAGRATEKVQEPRREVDVADLADQTSPMSLSSPMARVSTEHIMPPVDVVNQSNHALREATGGADAQAIMPTMSQDGPPKRRRNSGGK